MNFTVYFSDSGVPKDGLSATIQIWKVSDGSLVVDGSAMTQIQAVAEVSGFYYYTYAGAVDTEDYVALADSVTLVGSERYAPCITTTQGNTETIITDVGAIPTTMVGTDNAALASVCTETRLAELDGVNLPSDVAAIPTTMVGTDNAALASVCTEGRLAELDGANLPADVAAIPTTMVGTDNAATEAKQDTMQTAVNAIPTTMVGTDNAATEAKQDAMQLNVDDILLDTATIDWTDVDFIKAINGGKWDIVNNQMIFYDSDNVTVVATFNLFNSSDVAAMTEVTKRVRV